MIKRILSTQSEVILTSATHEAYIIDSIYTPITYTYLFYREQQKGLARSCFQLTVQHLLEKHLLRKGT